MKKTTRGRPKDPAKRQAILDAAGRLFLENAAADISMDQIARAAKVSKITIYRHFSDKSELLQSMIEKKLDENLSQDLYARLRGENVFEDLVQVAQGFTNVIYSDDGINMFRTVL
ncbi:MAG: TetR/AcrR family transcriptional regulator, partial [Pseudomonadota bacterium]